MDITSVESNRYSAKDYVYLELKKKIIEGELEPSQVINEKELATELEISRTPLREALQRIELEELIVRLPNRRMIVAPVSVNEAKEIFNVRSLLEGLVVKEATLNARDSDLVELKLLTDLLVHAANNQDNENVLSYGDKIHHFIYHLSKNNTVVKILNNMNDHIRRYRILGPKKNQSRGMAAALEHLEIYHAISKKDADLAEKLMKEHITNSLEAAIKSIEAHLECNPD